jgi:hypothetical protein
MDEAKTKVLSNGAVYDLETKRIVKGAVISSDRAVELVGIREQKRRDLARQMANGAVERGDFHAKYGDDAYMAAIIDTAMIKATTPEDPKAIESGRFVLTLTGEMDSAGAGGSASVPLSEVRGLVRDLADLGRVIAESIPVSNEL